MIEVSEIRVSLDQGATEEGCLDAARAAVCGLLGVKSRAIAHLELRRRSVDARRKNDVHLMLTARVRLRDAASEQAALSRVGSRDERRVRDHGGGDRGHRFYGGGFGPGGRPYGDYGYGAGGYGAGGSGCGRGCFAMVGVFVIVCVVMLLFGFMLSVL